MNQNVINRLERGEFITIGEYRHSKAEMLNWTDQKTGRAMSAPILRHTIEVGDNSIAVSERLPNNITKIEDIPPIPFKKGESVIFVVDELTRRLGLVSGKGRLEKVDQASAGNGAPAGAPKTAR